LEWYTLGTKASYFLYLVLALFLGSFFLPAIVTKEHIVPYGYDILRVGWIAALFGMFAWHSNLLAVIAFVCAKTSAYKTGIAFSFIAFLLGLQALTLRYIPTREANFGTCGLPDIVPPGPAVHKIKRCPSQT
jgi:hypothetical protein